MLGRRYTGPPFCSRSTLVPCNGAVILHASANAEEMGSKVIPILWTAGENDPLYVRAPAFALPHHLVFLARCWIRAAVASLVVKHSRSAQ